MTAAEVAMLLHARATPTLCLSVLSFLFMPAIARCQNLTCDRNAIDPRSYEMATVGQAQTLLNPGGMVLVEGERLHAFTEGILVEPQSPVEVLEIRGTRLLVRPVDRFAPSAEEVAEGGPQIPRPIDFELPGE